MKYDITVSRTHYLKHLEAFNALQAEVLRVDWSDTEKDLRDIPLVVGGMHHLRMTIAPNHVNPGRVDITFRITDEPGYREDHPDLKRIFQFFHRTIPPE